MKSLLLTTVATFLMLPLCYGEDACCEKKEDCNCLSELEDNRPWYEEEKNIDASWPSKREDPFFDQLTR